MSLRKKWAGNCTRCVYLKESTNALQASFCFGSGALNFMMSLSQKVIVVAFLSVLCAAEEKSGPVVKFTTGQVRGRVSLLEDSGHQADLFLGIPYAEPPVGERRFAAPEPAKAWSDVRDANKHGSRCPQNELPFPMNITIGKCL